VSGTYSPFLKTISMQANDHGKEVSYSGFHHAPDLFYERTIVEWTGEYGTKPAAVGKIP
jgi:hypothetical protein